MSLPDRDGAISAAADVGIALDALQAERLLAFVTLLQHWNRTYNLTAVREPAAMWRQHVLDCMAAWPPVRRRLPAARRVLDVGSGGGLPGLVWALLDPQLEVECVDAVAKKVAFVRQAAVELGVLNVSALHERIEVLRRPAFDLIASRAFASLSDFVRGSRHLLAPHGWWVALKGKRPDDELAALHATGADATVFHVEPLVVPDLGAERCLVWLPATTTPEAAQSPEHPHR